MKSFRFWFRLGTIILMVVLALVSQHHAPISSSAPQAVASSGYSETHGEIPQKAYEVLKIIRETGQAPEGYVGGRTFQNREGRLPSDGDYREFDVDPHKGHRNAERIIVEWPSKRAWYTGDHYETFIPMP
jgi:guanyl-specific ribonuclease Sa